MSSTVPAADLIDQAHAATTSEELDAIEAQAEGRVTVINAVHDRRDQLARQGADMSDTPVVDASPTQAPIAVNTTSLEDELAKYPAAASDDETLALKPNTLEGAVSGPHATVSSTAYVEMTKPDGSTFLSAKSSQEYYESIGYTAGADKDISDLNAYLDEQSKATP